LAGSVRSESAVPGANVDSVKPCFSTRSANFTNVERLRLVSVWMHRTPPARHISIKKLACISPVNMSPMKKSCAQAENLKNEKGEREWIQNSKQMKSFFPRTLDCGLLNGQISML